MKPCIRVLFWALNSGKIQNARFQCQFRPLRAQNTEKKIKKKTLNDLKLIFLELVQLDLYSGKVWENRDFFLYCMTVVDPYSKPLLSVSVNFYKEQQRAIPHKRNVHVIWSLVVKAKWKPRWTTVIPIYYEADEGTLFWGFSDVASKGYMQHKWWTIWSTRSWWRMAQKECNVELG